MIAACSRSAHRHVRVEPDAAEGWHTADCKGLAELPLQSSRQSVSPRTSQPARIAQNWERDNRGAHDVEGPAIVRHFRAPEQRSLAPAFLNEFVPCTLESI
jgi:hypothetical protein